MGMCHCRGELLLCSSGTQGKLCFGLFRSGFAALRTQTCGQRIPFGNRLQ